MKLNKFILTIAIFFVLFLSINISNAQEEQNFSPLDMDIPCINAQYDLKYGSRDYVFFGNVMKLQVFLYQNEFMDYPPTGYFGPITQKAMMSYQVTKSLNFTGVFDYLTRRMVYQDTCGTTKTIYQ